MCDRRGVQSHEAAFAISRCLGAVAENFSPISQPYSTEDLFRSDFFR